MNTEEKIVIAVVSLFTDAVKSLSKREIETNPPILTKARRILRRLNYVVTPVAEFTAVQHQSNTRRKPHG